MTAQLKSAIVRNAQEGDIVYDFPGCVCVERGDISVTIDKSNPVVISDGHSVESVPDNEVDRVIDVINTMLR